MRRAIVLACLTIALGSCTQFPEVDAAMDSRTSATSFPKLVPLDGLLAGIEEPRLDETTGPALARRAASLRWRAAQLRRTPVLSATERSRLLRAAARHSG